WATALVFAAAAGCAGEIDAGKSPTPGGSSNPGMVGGTGSGTVGGSSTPGGGPTGSTGSTGSPGGSGSGGGGSTPPPGGGGSTTVPQPPSVPMGMGAFVGDFCGGPVPSAFVTNCSGCHTQSGVSNTRYPDLFQFKGTAADFQAKVRSGSANMAPYPAEIISDNDLQAIYNFFTGNKRTGENQYDLMGAKPLFEPADAKNPPVYFKREDGAIVTRGAGRVRGRHEKEGSYGTFGSHYFEDRTYGFIVEDFTPTGKNQIRVSYLPIAMPDMNGNRITNWRAWKVTGNNATFAENKYMNNVTAAPMMPMGKTAAIQQYDQTTVPGSRRMAVGENFEFEFGIFIAPNGLTTRGTRDSYYTDTFRYRIGLGGLTANNKDYAATPGPLENAQLGGDTTIVWAVAEPETYFSQMALNTQQENVQNWVEGRRLFHTNFATGAHSETGNPAFTAQAGKAGPLFQTNACVNCHEHNGPGALLDGPLSDKSSMAFKLYNSGELGNQLQLQEGSASVAGFENKTVALGDGTQVMLRKPTFTVSATGGQKIGGYSARVARKLIGLGLLEA
ncbi:MAG TPA: di-heme oxidoredictase family protein, partial [Polyangia bacterium]